MTTPTARAAPTAAPFDAPGVERPFLFLRHGETDWNRQGVCQGQLDIGLNALGRDQAARAAALLDGEPIARIVTSPLRRARDTADAVARRRGLTVSADPDLREAHLGAHQGARHGPWLADYWRGAYAPPGGETFEEFVERAWAAMARAAALGPDTLIVAHGGLWRAAMRRVVVTPAFRMPNALPVRVAPEASGWRALPLAPLPDGAALRRAETDPRAETGTETTGGLGG